MKELGQKYGVKVADLSEPGVRAIRIVFSPAKRLQRFCRRPIVWAIAGLTRLRISTALAGRVLHSPISTASRVAPLGVHPLPASAKSSRRQHRTETLPMRTVLAS